MNIEFTNIVPIFVLVKIVPTYIFRLLMEWHLFVTLANFEDCEPKKICAFFGGHYTSL